MATICYCFEAVHESGMRKVVCGYCADRLRAQLADAQHKVAKARYDNETLAAELSNAMDMANEYAAKYDEAIFCAKTLARCGDPKPWRIQEWRSAYNAATNGGE